MSGGSTFSSDIIPFLSAFSIGPGNRLKYGYGYVCDDGFSSHSAKVVCLELGYGYATSYYPGQTVPVDKFLMDDLSCPSGSTRLSQCSFNTYENCGVSEGVQIFCAGNESILMIIIHEIIPPTTPFILINDPSNRVLEDSYFLFQKSLNLVIFSHLFFCLMQAQKHF